MLITFFSYLLLILNASTQAYELDNFYKPFGLELDKTTLKDFKISFTHTKTMQITGKSKERQEELELMVLNESIPKVTSKDVAFYENFNAISAVFNKKGILKTIVLSYMPRSFFDKFVVQINSFCELHEAQIYTNDPKTPQLLYRCGNIWSKVTVFDNLFLLKLSTDKNGLLYE